MDQTTNHPADIADQLERLPPEEAENLFLQLPRDQATAVFMEMDREQWPHLLERLGPVHLAEMMTAAPQAQAADILAAIPAERRQEILDRLPAPSAASISALMKYPVDTAGGIMSNQFLSLRSDQTVQECQELLRGFSETFAPNMISYLYVTDPNGKLVGIVSLHNLVFSRPERRLTDIMNPDVKQVWVDDDQEKIAQLFEHYHYMALPVVERDGRLVGIVAANQVIDVLRKEATEDMQLMVGLSGEERALTPWQRSLPRRLPWLCVNLGTAFLAASVVSVFEETIANWTALAIFLPIVAGQGGNAGAQTLTVIIRDMALGEMSRGDGRKALIKELILGLLNGLVIAVIVGVVGYLWKGGALLGVVVAIAMVLNMIAAALSGVLVPYSLKALRIDPALASSILVTTVTDVAGFFFFLGLATLVRSYA